MLFRSDTLREAADSAKLNPRALIGTAESVAVNDMNVSLRGEILTHVDRLRTGLTADSIPREPTPARTRPRPIRLRAPRLRPPEQFLAVTRSFGKTRPGHRSGHAARTATVPRQRRAARPRDRGRPATPRC